MLELLTCSHEEYLMRVAVKIRAALERHDEEIAWLEDHSATWRAQGLKHRFAVQAAFWRNTLHAYGVTEAQWMLGDAMNRRSV